ncbi:MAG: polysaccharide deacetylase family protein [Defluviitaleaceae bacterium]|nr:polysaccharide deacetylase family protein [Defluviitaleaceae bacterium]
MKTALICLLVTLAIPFGGLPAGTTAEIPIIMYHALDPSPSNPWEITEAEFEADLIWLTENGYTTVVMQDIINFVHQGAPLPEKPIILSFDDGRHPTIYQLLPLLEKYDARISLSIVGAFTDKYTEIVAKRGERSYPHMTWDDVSNAHASGRVEIQSHTYDLHHAAGAGRTRGESDPSYTARLLADLKRLADVLYKNTGLTTNTLAYPLGIISNISDCIIKEAGYLASLSCFHKSNTITVGDTEGLFSLNRFLRAPNQPLESILK